MKRFGYDKTNDAKKIAQPSANGARTTPASKQAARKNEKEKERVMREKEKEKFAREQAEAQAAQKREREQAQAARESEKEKERVMREKEKEKFAREQAEVQAAQKREREQAQAARKNEKEKERVMREKEKEKFAREQAEAQAAQKRERAREQAARESEKEKERAARKEEKARLQAVREKERARREKEREKARARSRAARKRITDKITKTLTSNPEDFQPCPLLLPRVCVEVEGDSVYVVNSLIKVGITVYGVERQDGKFTFTARKKDSAKIFAFLRKMCYNYTVLNNSGIRESARWCVARIGLIVAAAACVAAFVFQSGRIWRIEYTGNELLTSEQLTAALRNEGIAVGAKKAQPETVTAVLESLDGVAEATCSYNGTSLYVQLIESATYTLPKDYTFYKSDFDAVVTRIVTRRGTAVVKRGETVKRGDVLIEGTTYSSIGEPLSNVRADGEVYGNVALQYCVNFAKQTMTLTDTGKTAKGTGMTLFGKKLFSPKSPYAVYRSSARTVALDVIFPLYVTNVEFIEQEYVLTNVDANAVATAFKNEKIDEAAFCFDTFTVNEELSEENGMYRYTLFLQGEKLISSGVA